MAALIEARGLVKQFGTIRAVDGISLSVQRGEVLGFLGPNGAGKSTTMKMITGFLEPDAGQASIAGFDVKAEPIAAKRQLGYLPEGAPAYGDMTVAEFLGFIAEIRGFRGADAKRRMRRAIEHTSLEGVLGQTIDTLSKGFKRRVGIAQAILHEPAVLIMDEPTDGLDPNQKHQVRELIRALAEATAIIVSTHILEEVEAVCSRAVIINRGRIVADGTADELTRRAPGHGAVTLRLAASREADTRAALAGMPVIAGIETVSAGEGQVKLRIAPVNGQAIADDIMAALVKRDVAIEAIDIERGRLEDVFRAITTTDTPTPAPAPAATAAPAAKS